MILDTRKLWKANPADLYRLARFLGVPSPKDGCACFTCRGRVVRGVSRALITGRRP